VRLFVAIEVPASIDEVTGAPPPSAPEHLTLRFLGDLPEETILPLRSALELVARATPPFEVVFEGVGAFPSRANPRVVWVGVSRGREEVTSLAVRTAAALEGIVGAPDRERFVPHLTLFRVRSPAQRSRAQALLAGTEPPPSPRAVRVRDLFLKQSTLAPRGAVHRTVATFPLGSG